MSKIANFLNNIRNITPARESQSPIELGAEYFSTLSYKTPYFLFDRKKILRKYHEFEDIFPNHLVYYAVKANSESEILKVLTKAGCGFEAASKYELDMLKKIQVPAEKIVYGTSVKPADHIKDFYHYGVRVFASDSLPELEKIAAVAPGSKVYIRIVANDSGSVFKFSEKFGTETKNVIPLLLRAKELGLYPYGISFHVGSQASDAKAWANTLEEIHPLLQELKDKNIILDVINIGGGYPCQYVSSENTPTVNHIASYMLEPYQKLPYHPKIMTEPGRGIIADTGVLIASVIGRVERKENTWLFLDAGCYNAMFETMAYQGSTIYPVSCMRSAGDVGEARFALAGPTGDSEDVMTREALLPADIDVGDKLIFYHVGAYSLTAASPFNGFPRPEVYYI